MSRLLDRGPHSVMVTPMTASQDAYGTSLTPGEPVLVERVMIQPVSAPDSDQATSQVGVASWRILGAGVWPGGTYSTVRVMEGPAGMVGREFDQSGEPLQFGSGRRTRHFEVTVTAAGLEER